MKIIDTNNTTLYNFTGYKQNFPCEKLKTRIAETLRASNINAKKIGKRVNGELIQLKTYKEIFKNKDFEPIVELSLGEEEIIGKITYYNSNPVELKHPLNKKLKPFFKKVCVIADSQVKEDILKQSIWNISQEEKYLESKLHKRFNELAKEQKTPNPIILFYDSIYSNLTKKLLEITIAKNEKLTELEKIRKNLKKYKE